MAYMPGYNLCILPVLATDPSLRRKEHQTYLLELAIPAAISDGLSKPVQYGHLQVSLHHIFLLPGEHHHSTHPGYPFESPLCSVWPHWPAYGPHGYHVLTVSGYIRVCPAAWPLLLRLHEHDRVLKLNRHQYCSYPCPAFHENPYSTLPLENDLVTWQPAAHLHRTAQQY